MLDLISIIVPIYNTGTYLDRCVESLVNQDYPNVEIVLVDDGSTDSVTIAKCEELEKKYDKVRVLRKDNGGLSSARNAGVSTARGKYVGFVDSDDYVEAHMYSTLYRIIKENHVPVAFCGIDYHSESKIIKQDQDVESGCYERETVLHHFLLGHWHSACSALYDKSLFEHNRFPEKEINEDYIFNYSVLSSVDKVGIYREGLYNYINRYGSITQSGASLKVLDWLKHTSFIYEELKNNKDLSKEAEFQYLYSNIVIVNKALLTLGREKSDEASMLFSIGVKNLQTSRKLLPDNSFFTKKYVLMRYLMTYVPYLYKVGVLSILKIKRV